MKQVLDTLRAHVFLGFLYLALVWVIIALGLNIAGLVISAVDSVKGTNYALGFANELHWKFDGAFKNHPGNIYYNEQSVAIGLVTNKVKIGALAGNRNLEFGVQNLLEEALQDKGWDIDHASNNRIELDIVYLDVLKTQSSMSVFHKDKEAVVIRLYARYYEGDKLSKKFLVEESAEEVSVSTLVIDKGGKFNQQNLSSALKKAVVAVVNKL